MSSLNGLGDSQVCAVLEYALPLLPPMAGVAPPLKEFAYLSRVATLVDGQRLLLKFARSAPEVARFVRTAEVTTLARAGGVVTPAILYAGRSGPAARDLPLMVQEYWPGSDGKDSWPQLDLACRLKFLFSFGSAVARLHRITATAFTESPGVSDAGWAAHVKRRIDRLQSPQTRAGVLTPNEMSRFAERAQTAADAVTAFVAPALTHRDLSLRNTLVSDGEFSGVLDFEHARFSDPVLDLALLQLQVFEVHPATEAPFRAGYRSIMPTPYPREQERIELAIVLEGYGSIPYLIRQNQTAKAAKWKSRLAAWS